MSAAEREQSTRPHVSVIWHDLECGGYQGDLELWRDLTGSADGPVLDLGCGTGRVALDLARCGRVVRGLDLVPELVAAFNDRASASALSAEATAGDARDFALGQQFGMILAPMQTIQLLGGDAERIACLSRVRSHLPPGGSAAIAIVDGFPAELTEAAPPPLPDTLELDGWLYSSLPLDAGLEPGAIIVRRLRQTVSPAGKLSEELDEVPLRLLSAETIEGEAREAGLAPAGRRQIPPTDAHIGSTVVLLERSP